ncbi:MAG TPA: PLP-dependent aspartate aminotransferase family protein [Candidatus Woesearchaeota archaeon]|nr:PLP-dependent aspartate aminotransferase family protein [Candidatus Woesearchaeota archaeon]
MEKNKKVSFNTLAIHGAGQNDQNQSLNDPIYMTSTFTFKDLDQADDTFSFKRRAYVYTRGGNPTINLFEKRVALLESGVDSVAFASGMAAITSTILSNVKAGDEIIFHKTLYGSAYGFITHILPKYSVNAIACDFTKLNEVESLISPKTKLIYFETPTNPSMEIIDIKEISKIAKRQNVKVVVDNTFATPYFQRPLELGADIVIHSATKYISGHGDALGGITTSKDQDYIYHLKFGYMCELGGVISPFNAWLMLRGIKTLGIRMKKIEENAKLLANFLLKSTKVEKVLYPGIETHNGYDIAKKQMDGFGGVLSFELQGDLKRAKDFVSRLKMIKLAVSLGDTETLVEIPALMTHRDYSEPKLEEFGFSKKTIRISCGIEDIDDILEDVSKAL